MNIRQLRFFLQIAELGSMTRAATFLHIAQPALSRQIQQLEGRIGERVWIWNGQWKRPHGTAAEYIVLPTAQAVPLPGNVSYAEGACLGIPAFTAVQAVRLAALTHGTTVLIAGGAGSVAHSSSPSFGG